MNKFAKAILLALVVAVPVAISTSEVQAKTVTPHQQVSQNRHRNNHTVHPRTRNSHTRTGHK